jgi:Ser/Thr protein kinase RdoA (MazF antagonist)
LSTAADREPRKLIAVSMDSPSNLQCPTVPTALSLLAEFGLPGDTPFETLAAGRRSTHYLTASEPRLVIRVSKEHTASVHAEPTVAGALRMAGFESVPRFRHLGTRPGEWHCRWEGQGLVSVYEYIPGATIQPLSDGQFAAVLPFIERFRTVADEVSDPRLLLPGAFGRVAHVLERASESPLIRRAPHVERFSREAETSELMSRLNSAPVLTHGDLHGGNIVWTHENLPAGLIDFASAGLGHPELEIAALATGICFTSLGLQVGRLAALVERMSTWLGQLRGDALVETLALTSLSFFLEINNEAREDTEVVWRDLLRAEEILQRRGEIVATI